jgi:hypothetical protein
LLTFAEPVETLDDRIKACIMLLLELCVPAPELIASLMKVPLLLFSLHEFLLFIYMFFETGA